MTGNDFCIGWRLLIAEPAHSAVVILGLTLGLAASFLLLGFVHYSFTYDSEVPNSDQVYVFKHKVNLMPQARWTEFMPLPVRDVLLGSGLPLTVSVVMPRSVTVTSANRTQKIELTMVDPAFQAMFGVPVIKGDLQAALTRPDGIALTREGAQKLFGSGAALGRTIDIDGKPVQVMALIEDAPTNTTVPYTYLVGTASAAAPLGEHKWNRIAGKVFVRPAPAVAPATLARLVQEAADQSVWKTIAPRGVPGFEHVMDVAIGRLSDAYFDTEVASFRGGVRANKMAVLGLAATALLILLVAAINYVNLATVRTVLRQREIGIRKALGANRARLVAQFMAESMLVTLIASALGLMLAWLLLPLFSTLVDRKLVAFFTPVTVMAGLALGLMVGLASGLYPSIIALGVRANVALGGRAGAETAAGQGLRRVLTVLQFAVAIALGAGALAVSWQTFYATARDPGFDPEPLMLIELPKQASAASIAALRAALARLPHVSGVAVSEHAIGAPDVPWSSSGFARAGGSELKMNQVGVSANFFDLYRIGPSAGRMFDPRREIENQTHVVVINEAAARAFGFGTPAAAVGQRISRLDDGYWEIIGVAQDIAHQNLHEAIQPVIYMPDLGDPGVLTVRADATLEHDQIAALWASIFPNDALQLYSAHSILAKNYREDRRLATMLIGSSLIAVDMATFGIYVLAAYSVQRRRREIALRKLYGASPGAIARLVGIEFAALIALAALIGLPLAALGIERYLANFVERAPLGAWPLLAALTLAVLVALTASWRHTRAAMRVAPTIALHD